MSDKVSVSEKALGEVLGALVGPSHLIREIQATMNIPADFEGIGANPLATLIGEYNTHIEAYNASLPKDKE